MNEFTVEQKKVSHGKKTLVTVSYKGEVIGSRTSARPYRRILITRRNQEWEYNRAMREAKWNIEESIRLARIAARQSPEYSKSVATYGLASVEKDILNGNYLKWSQSHLDQNVKWSAEAVRIDPVNNPALPEFDVPSCQSWHQGKVPSAPESRKFVTVLEIPQKPL